jgi:DNA-binding CsgD family transcriptional regulator
MSAQDATSARDDATRPRLFAADEWQRIVSELMLSKRQAEVVGLLMQSNTDKEISKLLNVKETTVYTHLKIAKSRLKAVDRVGLCYRVFECFRRTIEGSHPRK